MSAQGTGVLTREAGAPGGRGLEPPMTAKPVAQGVERPAPRGRLFRKYVALFVGVVAVALVANGLFEIWFSYEEHEDALIRIQSEQAQAAAAKIEQFVQEIQNQIGWTTQLPWSAGTLEQRRFDALRLLRQVPAITELARALDAAYPCRARGAAGGDALRVLHRLPVTGGQEAGERRAVRQPDP